MNYCEKCNCQVEGQYCKVCGTNNVRPIDDNDFCYFVTINAMWCEMFEDALKHNEIDAVCVPHYTYNVTPFNAGRADSRRVYLRYGNLDKAKEIYAELFGDHIGERKI